MRKAQHKEVQNSNLKGRKKGGGSRINTSKFGPGRKPIKVFLIPVTFLRIKKGVSRGRGEGINMEGEGKEKGKIYLLSK